MKKVYQVIVVCISLSLLIFFLSKKYITDSTVNPLNSCKTAQLISELYKSLGPRIGSHLVESNVVLTLAGLRGYAGFVMHDLTDSEAQDIEKVNEKTERLGIRFVLERDTENEISYIIIYNLKGFEYTFRMSKLPFVKPFDWASGFNGIDIWLDNIRNSAEKYFDIKPEAKLSIEALDSLMSGLMFGYPDQALLDSYNILSAGKNYSVLVLSNIPYADYYESAQPNFAYLPEHENEESIVKIKKSWGDFLKEFYNTSWHKVFAKDPYFKQIRALEEKAHQEWFNKQILKS